MPNNPQYDRKPYHFGFMIGFNEMDFTLRRQPNFNIDPQKEGILDLYSVDVLPEKGFNVGIISNLRLNDHLDFRFIPDLAFGERNIKYLYSDTVNRTRSVVKKIESTYVEFPFLFKYKGVRLLNARPYIVGGLKYSMDLASQAKKKKKTDDNEDLVKIKRNDISGEVGLGFDFYLKYFKFATEVKMSYGLINIIDKEDTYLTNSIDRMSSKIFMISFLFE